MDIFIKKDQRPSQSKVVFASLEDIEKKSSRWPYKQAFQPLLKEGFFKGNKLQSCFLPTFQGKSAQNLILIGLGEEKSIDYEVTRQASAKAFKVLLAHEQKEADFDLQSCAKSTVSDWERLTQACTEGLLLAQYVCDEFKQKKQEKSLKKACIDLPQKAQQKGKKGLNQGLILGHCVNVARKVSNYPGNLMTPSLLAQEVQKQAQNTKIKTTVWDKKRIIKEKMGGLLGVSLGSSQEPRFIIMEYKGASASQKPICFVGKGLTFDSGGISIKPSAAMDEMKFDMCGSAAVIGALLAIEKLKLKVNVVGLIPSSENMPGQGATKPGDILKARNGKTMEVLNTDAEGRLILADALSYASEKKPQAIFDAATLTGAMVVSLGNIYTGFFTKHEKLVSKVLKASQTSGEKVWRMPLCNEHTKDMESALADVSNLSHSRGAGSSTAAAFLEHFVKDTIPWVHFDIAGTAWSVSKRLEYCRPRMASGVMVRTFVELAKSFQ